MVLDKGNIAECELSVSIRAWLRQRIGSLDDLQQLLGTWMQTRKVSPVRWQFTNAQARTKLRRPYPIKANEREHQASSLVIPELPAFLIAFSIILYGISRNSGPTRAASMALVALPLCIYCFSVSQSENGRQDWPFTGWVRFLVSPERRCILPISRVSG